MLHARTLPLAVLAAAALALPGCGGDDSGGGGDDEAQIRDTVTTYAAAIADGDGETACGFLTNAARSQVESAGEALGADGCAEILDTITKEASDDDRDELKDLEITSIEVEGDRATAQVKAGGEQGDPSTLVKEDGEWRIDADAGGTNTATAERPTVATVTTPSP